MDLLTVLLNLGTGVGANFATSGIKTALGSLFKDRPDLDRRISNPTSGEDLQSALSEVASQLQVLAASGSVQIDGAVITALSGARFDHNSGRIHIGNTTVSAARLQTGGTGPGQTVISGNTELRSS